MFYFSIIDGEYEYADKVILACPRDLTKGQIIAMYNRALSELENSKPLPEVNSYDITNKISEMYDVIIVEPKFNIIAGHYYFKFIPNKEAGSDDCDIDLDDIS